MRTFFAALFAAAAIAAPSQALAAKPVPLLQVTASAIPTAAVGGGTGCLVTATGTWDGTRVAGVGFAVYDSSGLNQGYVEGGSVTLDPRPARSGSLSWTTSGIAAPGSIRVVAVFFDHRGFDVGTTETTISC